jgi:23S rRNA (adenine2503-C2)-methyltransferase
MGCGEPLDNFDAVIRFIELITHPMGINIGSRHITLSTCGLVSRIYELAVKKLQITLAVSLNGPTDDVRAVLMPIAKKYPVRDLINACRYYAETTRRRVTFEYVLAKGINDSHSHAKELATVLKGIMCHVNIIPINKVTGIFSPTPRKAAEDFAGILQQNRISATVRRSLGTDIDAACGQLRAKKLKKEGLK